MRQRWSQSLLWLSLLSVMVQDLWLFALSGVTLSIGSAVVALLGGVLLIVLGLVALARWAGRKAWLG
ncbi:MAG: hypothetical protein QM661_09165 [Solimonas sp.]